MQVSLTAKKQHDEQFRRLLQIECYVDTHDSGSAWMANPSLYDSCIHYSLPVIWRIRKKIINKFLTEHYRLIISLFFSDKGELLMMLFCFKKLKKSMNDFFNLGYMRIFSIILWVYL